MQHGLYERRTNIAEAEYIAEMVIQLLLKESQDSIGIVAFSQEQQNEIEDALERRVQGDAALAALLEKAYERTEDDQFVGLFVKNLENVQGDERDIIIMSVCYGYDARKKMLMNFGPINRKGGEKRLNVIFSRARKHMAVVASIKYTDIRNEYNEGANYLRKYLQYAALVSGGHSTEAMQVLDSMSLQKNAAHASISSIALDIAQSLENKGWYVQSGLGQSHFKVSLGVKHQKSDTEFALGIILDDALHYADPDIEGNYFQRAEILRSFGWKVTQVFCKDWLERREKVMQHLEKLLGGQYAEEELPLPEKEIVQETTSEILENPVQPIVEEVANTEEKSLVYLECIEGTSSKFWEAKIEGASIVVRYGRIGTKGTDSSKSFSNAQEAQTELDRLVHSKLKKGYIRK
jgi:predicted DNA-binding WGR domain protein